MNNNILYRKSVSSGNQSQICVPISLIEAVLNENHGSALSGHFGQRKTLWRIILHFYWKGMALDVINFVKTCHECQLRKPRNTKNHSFQTPIPVAHKPFQFMSFDLIGPLPNTSSEERYIMTVTDQLTKFAIACPLENKSEIVIMHALENEVFYRYGSPQYLLSDQDTSFSGNMSNKVYKSWNVKHLRTAAFRPQCNGQTEKFNHSLAIQLTIQCNGEKESWNEYVMPTVYAYNTAINESTGFTPIELALHRIPTPLIATKLGHNYDSSEIPSISFEEKLSIARRNIMKNQRNNQIRRNTTRVECNIKVGDLVLYEYVPLTTAAGAKLNNRFLGPFKVIEKINENSFYIHSTTGTFRDTTVNATQLKIYYPRNTFVINCKKHLNNRLSSSAYFSNSGMREKIIPSHRNSVLQTTAAHDN